MATKGETAHIATVILGDRGRMVLPAPVRRRIDARTGDRFAVRVDEDGTVRLISHKKAAEATSGLYAHLAPGRSLVDELIAERREEAAREASL